MQLYILFRLRIAWGGYDIASGSLHKLDVILDSVVSR